MEKYRPHLDWIDDRHDTLVALVEAWCSVNSGSYNLSGLETMLGLLRAAFTSLGGEDEVLPLPPYETVDLNGTVIQRPLGNALSVRKHPEAPVQVLLSGHMDTVYPADSPFQTVTRVDSNHLRGPGVADLKGGLVVMLTALQALERSPFAEKIGWEVLLSPDEEIGSPGSGPLLEERAQRVHLGLVYEPSYADGAFVHSRKGSANFTVIVHGRAAHVGRHYGDGRSAIRELSKFILKAEKLNDLERGITVNFGRTRGGIANNVVPPLAVGSLNVRAATKEGMDGAKHNLADLIMEGCSADGITMEMHGEITRPPKLFDKKTQMLFEHFKACSELLDLPYLLRESGGVCDGNILAAAGLPTIDTIGVRGGDIHTHHEYLLLDSLISRSKLSALFLMKLAEGEFPTTKEIYR